MASPSLAFEYHVTARDFASRAGTARLSTAPPEMARELCRSVVLAAGVDDRSVRVGTRKVFLAAEAYGELREARRKVEAERAVVLQQGARGMLARAAARAERKRRAEAERRRRKEEERLRRKLEEEVTCRAACVAHAFLHRETVESLEPLASPRLHTRDAPRTRHLTPRPAHLPLGAGAALARRGAPASGGGGASRGGTAARGGGRAATAG